MNHSAELEKQEAIRQTVRSGYAAVATGSSGAACSGSTCCGGESDSAEALAQAVGYSKEELELLPSGANMGLSCGNPVALAGLREGEVVVDLGSGGGFDVFIAGRKVGPSGHVIGVDMTPEMLAKARRNVGTYISNTGLSNVEFRLGEIEHLPIANATADVVISNCVINLSPDKPQVYREIARVLRPGGHFRFATDIDDYAAWTLERVAREPRLAWTASRADDWRLPWDGWTRTRYEAKAVREGRRPSYLVFERV
jgi:SAM-dependent methyltransferase